MMEKFATRLCLTEAEADTLHHLLQNANCPALDKPRKRLELWKKRWNKMIQEQQKTLKKFTESDKVWVKYNPEHRRSGQVGKVMKIEWWDHEWHYFVGFRDGDIMWFLPNQLEKEV